MMLRLLVLLKSESNRRFRVKFWRPKFCWKIRISDQRALAWGLCIVGPSMLKMARHNSEERGIGHFS